MAEEYGEVSSERLATVKILPSYKIPSGEGMDGVTGSERKGTVCARRRQRAAVVIFLTDEGRYLIAAVLGVCMLF